MWHIWKPLPDGSGREGTLCIWKPLPDESEAEVQVHVNWRAVAGIIAVIIILSLVLAFVFGGR
jgi:hypothetical protein